MATEISPTLLLTMSLGFNSAHWLVAQTSRIVPICIIFILFLQESRVAKLFAGVGAAGVMEIRLFTLAEILAQLLCEQSDTPKEGSCVC